jgi:hypothetical protein
MSDTSSNNGNDSQNAPPNNGTNPAGGGNTPNQPSIPGPGTPTNIDNLGAGLQDLIKDGPPDLKLSDETKKKYLALITNFRTGIQYERDAMDRFTAIGDPGTLESASQTKNNFVLDVTGYNGIRPTLNNYLNYLDAFADTLQKAADRALNEG